MGHGFTSGGQESGSVFSTAVCKIQARKRYLESLPSVPKIKEAASLKVKGPLCGCLLTGCLPSGSIPCLIDIWLYVCAYFSAHKPNWFTLGSKQAHH